MLRLSDGNTGYVPLYLLGYAALLLAAFVHRLGFVTRSLILLGVLYAVAISGFLLNGIASTAPVFLFGAVAMATVLFEVRWGVAALLVSVATMSGLGTAIVLRWLELTEPAYAATPGSWFTDTAIFLGLGAATLISTTFLIRRLEGSVETSAELVLSLQERVHERRRAEQALRESEARLLEAQRVARIGSFEWDFRSRTLWWSDEMYHLLGWRMGGREPRLETFLERVHSDDRKRIAAALAGWPDGERPAPLEFRIALPDGSIRHARAEPRLERRPDGRPKRLHGTVQDVTEARELEQQLRQSQKLEAVGQLAGGVAHDFNNLLTVITGYGEGLLAELGGEPREAVREICLAAERAAALTRQLLAFGRQELVQPRVLDLNAVVLEFEGMLRRLVGENVRCQLSLDSSLGPVTADAGQLQQILLNLSLNARDAMPEGGNLVVRTHEIDAPAERAAGVAGSGPARYVCLSVSDDGCGMDAETQARIFEPFFTTKDPGKGTGLGLFTVYGIVKQSDGQIRVQSSPGRGTLVEVLLPRAADLGEPAASGPSLPEVEQRGSETILLVEDDAAVRRLIREALGSCGYRILEAGDGAEALAIAARHPEDLDLVVADVVMPRIGGVALVERLRKVRPKLRALLISGYAHRVGETEEALGAGTALLEKPFGPGEVTRRVREVLDA
jgi:signal transduction histidine kinase